MSDKKIFITIPLSLVQPLIWSLEDVFQYLTDNSCGDPDCCGEILTTENDYKEAVNSLESLGITIYEDL